MKLKWYLLIGLFAGLVLGPFILKIPGSTYILLDDTAIEFTNFFAVSVLLISLIGFWFLWLILRYILRTSNFTLGWFGDRGSRKARQNTIDGMIALAEGHWKTAEGLLSKGAKENNTQLINYLAAARASQEQNDHQSRDNYLKLAAEAQPEAQVAVGLTQAQLQIQHQQFEQALATLNHLRTLSPHHPHILKMLHRLYIALNDWQQVIDLIPKLRKNRVLTPDEINASESHAYFIRLSKTETKGLEACEVFWQQLPSQFRKTAKFQTRYVQILIKFQQFETAEALIKEGLKKHWNEQLVNLWGDIQSQQASKSLASAEQLLKQKPNNNALLTCLGKLSLQAQLWGKAKSYLEQSLASQPTAEAYFYLAKAFEQLGHPLNAQEQYKAGLEFQVKNPAQS